MNFLKKFLSKEKTNSLDPRENLLRLNDDLLFPVYDKEKEVDDLLACKKDQVNNLKGLEDNKLVLIIDMEELEKGKFVILAGEIDKNVKYGDDGSYKVQLDDGTTIRGQKKLSLTNKDKTIERERSLTESKVNEII